MRGGSWRPQHCSRLPICPTPSAATARPKCATLYISKRRPEEAEAGYLSLLSAVPLTLAKVAKPGQKREPFSSCSRGPHAFFSGIQRLFLEPILLRACTIGASC